jgi:hypothetical protein
MSLIESGPHIRAAEAARQNIEIILASKNQTTDFVSGLAITYFNEIKNHDLSLSHRMMKLSLRGIKVLVLPAATALAGTFFTDHLLGIAKNESFFQAVGKIVTEMIIFGVVFYAIKTTHVLETALDGLAKNALPLHESELNQQHVSTIYLPQIDENLKTIYDEMADYIEAAPFNQTLLDQTKAFKSKLPLIRKTIRSLRVDSHRILKKIETVIHERLQHRVMQGAQFNAYNATLLKELSPHEFAERIYSHRTIQHLNASKEWKIPRSIAGTLLPLLLKLDLPPFKIPPMKHLGFFSFDIPYVNNLDPFYFKAGLYGIAIICIAVAMYEVKHHLGTVAGKKSTVKDDVHTLLLNLTTYFQENPQQAGDLVEKLDEIKQKLQEKGFNADLLQLPAA